jgi:hypothetical protein
MDLEDGNGCIIPWGVGLLLASNANSCLGYTISKASVVPQGRLVF